MGSLNDTSGTINPGDSSTITGILTDKGAYTQGSSGLLDMSIGGTKAGTQFDELNATTVNLNGTLDISLIKGFVPTIGQTFKIMNFTSESGTFSTVNGLAINGSEHFTITYQGSDVLLTVVSGAGPNSLATSSSRFLHNMLRQPALFAGSNLRGTLGARSFVLNSSSFERASILGPRWMPARVNSTAVLATPSFVSNLRERSTVDAIRVASGAMPPSATFRSNLLSAPVSSEFRMVSSSMLSRPIFAHNNLRLAVSGSDFRALSAAALPSLKPSVRIWSAGSDFHTFSDAAALRIEPSNAQFPVSSTRLGGGGALFTNSVDLHDAAHGSTIPMTLRNSTRSPRASSGALPRTRFMVGGLSWNLSNLLAKPKVGFGIQ